GSALVGEGPPITYTIVRLGNDFVCVDTSAACVNRSIRSSGTPLDTSAFFLPPGAPADAGKLDDGTAGPIDLGFNMTMFGNIVRYVGGGEKGGFALSGSKPDKVERTAGGYYPAWTFPQKNPRHGGRSDTAPGHNQLMPGNFIAPLWSDLYYGDSARQCGRI